MRKKHKMLAPLLTTVLLGQTTPSPTAEVLRLTNAAREKQGLSPLGLNEALTKAAQAHADDMAKNGYFSHEAPDGTDMVIRIDRVGYRYRGIAENIAMGQRTPKQAVDGWLKSPGHRRNMLNSAYQDLGVGISKDQKGILRWVQVFGTPR